MNLTLCVWASGSIDVVPWSARTDSDSCPLWASLSGAVLLHSTYWCHRWFHTNTHTFFKVSSQLWTLPLKPPISECQFSPLEHILSCLLKRSWTTLTSYKIVSDSVFVSSDNPSNFLVQKRSFDEDSDWKLAKLFLADSLSSCPSSLLSKVHTIKGEHTVLNNKF